MSDKIKENKPKWRKYLERMNDERITKQALRYKTGGYKRSKKKWSD